MIKAAFWLSLRDCGTQEITCQAKCDQFFSPGFVLPWLHEIRKSFFFYFEAKASAGEEGRVMSVDWMDRIVYIPSTQVFRLAKRKGQGYD